MKSYWNYTQTDRSIAPANKFKDAFDECLEEASHLDIVTGYVGKNQIESYAEALINKSQSGARIRILVGMAFRESLSQSTFDPWRKFDQYLRDNSEGSGIYSFRMPIHSKVYLTYNDDLSPLKTYVGSSNFNFSTPYMECTVQIPNRPEINQFVHGLFEHPYRIDFEDVSIRGTIKDPQSNSSQAVPRLKKSNLIIDRSNLDLVEEINLREVCRRNPIASLNLYHSAGRRSGNKWIPRTWYEVELTLGNRNFPNIPRDFKAITDNGYEIQMQRRSGAPRGQSHMGLKDLTSKDNRRIFGHWIKSKLEKSESLMNGDVIDDETFDHYGNDTLKFYKIDDERMFMEF